MENEELNKGVKTLIICFTIAIIILLILLQKCGNSLNNIKQDETVLLHLNDSLTKHRNKDSSLTVSTTLLQSQNLNLILQIESRDATIKLLQEELKKNKDKIKNGGSVTVIGSETTYTSAVTTTIIVNTKDTCNDIYLGANQDTTWIKWNTKANKDSTKLTLKVKDKYSVVLGSKKIGLFKYEPIVEVTSFNPYTDIKNMKAFKVLDKQKTHKISLGIQGGYGFTLKGLSPYVGIGINYRLL